MRARFISCVLGVACALMACMSGPASADVDKSAPDEVVQVLQEVQTPEPAQAPQLAPLTDLRQYISYLRDEQGKIVRVTASPVYVAAVQRSRVVQRGRRVHSHAHSRGGVSAKVSAGVCSCGCGMVGCTCGVSASG